MNYKKIISVVSLVMAQCAWGGLSFAADGIKINNMQVVTDEEADATTTEILGLRGGYVHPYFSVRGEYTDNLYNVDIDKKNNFLTVLSPGIWLATPAVREIPITITPHNTASGGLRLDVQEKEIFDRFKAYLLGGADVEFYSQDSDLNTTNYRFEGMLQFNIRGGLALRVLDRYARDQDRFDVNSFTVQDLNVSPAGINLSDPSNVRRFKNNLGRATLNWDMTEKFTARADYTNFYLDYDGTENDWLNRTDNSLGAYLYYNYSPKTSIFTEYRYVDANYNDVNDRDNDQNFVYGGVDWKATAKTSFMAKAGYQGKSYDADDSTVDSFTFELLSRYRVTEKTGLKLSVYKALEESDSVFYNGRDTLMIKLGYEQKIYNRFIGLVDFWYSDENYDQKNSSIEFDQFISGDREDNRYYVKVALQYVFLDWLMAEAAYSYDNRDSNRDLYDYDTNTIMFSLNSAL